MGTRRFWRDLWLVLTVVTTSACLATFGLVLAGLFRDPPYIVALLTRLDWFTSWPPVPDPETLTLLAPPALAFLAWRFHRFYQDALQPPSDDQRDNGDGQID